ncbi:hypothetical protein HQ533_04580 [Candidatus Woesearchaeota archaeon]|nr:hypothetical protein [Candidatus Woesearchaeota archaeon]
MSIKREVGNHEKELEQKSCVVCKETAEFCMRGLPENTYCRDCTKEYFKLLSYLEKLK